MRTRDKTYTDYGLSETDREIVKIFCLTANKEEKSFILSVCLDVKEEIAAELYYSFIRNLSYDKIDKINCIYMKKSDFYGYKKKCITEIIKRGYKYLERVM